jgi:hypothetical protein
VPKLPQTGSRLEAFPRPARAVMSTWPPTNEQESEDRPLLIDARVGGLVHKQRARNGGPMLGLADRQTMFVESEIGLDDLPAGERGV